MAQSELWTGDMSDKFALPILKCLAGRIWVDLASEPGFWPISAAIRLGVAKSKGWVEVDTNERDAKMWARITPSGFSALMQALDNKY